MGLPLYILEDYPKSYDQLLQTCVNRLLKWQILLIGELDNQDRLLTTLSKFRRGLIKISKIRRHSDKKDAYLQLREEMEKEEELYHQEKTYLPPEVFKTEGWDDASIERVWQALVDKTGSS